MSHHAEPNTIIPPAGPTFMVTSLSIAKSKTLSMGAKVLYPRLVLYAGKDGVCFPSQERLAEDIGVSARQVRRYLEELHDARLIDWERTKTTCRFTIYSLEFPRPDNNVLPDRTETSTPERTGTSYKKMSLNRGSVKDVALACAPLTHRAVNVPQPPIRKIQEYPKLRKVLAQFMANMQALRPEHYPSHEQVAELVHACEIEGLGESWIQNELAFLYNAKGIRYGVTGGPYSFKWFISTLSGRASDEIERRDARGEPAWDHDGMRMVS